MERPRPRKIGFLRQPQQHARQRQPHKPGILRLAKTTPFEVVHLLENLRHIERSFQFRKAVEPEERGVDPGNKRSKRSRRDTRNLRERFEVIIWMYGAG